MTNASGALLSPAAEAWLPQQKPDFLSGPLEGKTVAIVTNGWSSMVIMTELMTRLLKEKYGVREVLVKELPNTALPAPTVDSITGKAAAAIVGLAN